MYWAKRRDAVEREIVNALEARGATVHRMDGVGCPDLLVGYKGRTLLMEVKDPKDGARNSREGGKKVGNPLGLRDSQMRWWAWWRGDVPYIVTSVSEALRALT